jgi:peptide/nickel transport system ATP-binding protein
VDALAGVDLTIERGRVVALGRGVRLGQVDAGALSGGQEEPTSGEIRFDGAGVSSLRGAARRAFRESVQLLFQDSAAALSPRLTASEIVSEPLEILGRGDRAERRRRALELMETVGLLPRRRTAGPSSSAAASASGWPSRAPWP